MSLSSAGGKVLFLGARCYRIFWSKINDPIKTHDPRRFSFYSNSSNFSIIHGYRLHQPNNNKMMITFNLSPLQITFSPHAQVSG
jgi:hypothetical protein